MNPNHHVFLLLSFSLSYGKALAKVNKIPVLSVELQFAQPLLILFYSFSHTLSPPIYMCIHKYLFLHLFIVMGF